MINCRENTAFSGMHKPTDGQTTPTMHIYHCGSYDQHAQMFEHQRYTVWFVSSIRGQLYKENG